MGKHVRTRPLRSHRKPSAVKAAASTTAAAMGTATVGAVIAASGHHAPSAAILPAARQAASVTVSAPARDLPVRQAASSWVTVRDGDTLSGIARDDCGSARDWTGIFKRNKKVIGGDPDIIQPGQKLELDCLAAGIPVAAVTVASRSTLDGDRDHDGDRSDAAASPVHAAVSGGYSVSSGFQACVIRAESGGNPQIWNPSRHWGLYQFSASTWAAHGGDPALFGKADAAYQTQIFWNTVRQDGTSDWAPYDGC